MNKQGAFAWLAAAMFAAACQISAGDAAKDAPTGQATQAISARGSLPDAYELSIPWGGPQGFTLRQAESESVAYGPNAVAVAADGSSLILDRLAGRIARVSPSGGVSTFAAVAVDTEDLVAGAESVVAFSPVRARAIFFDGAGTSVGELAVPRELREITRLSLAPSRRLVAHTGFQESLELGSPSAPMALEVTLAGKREGSYRLPDGMGVAVRAIGGRAELLVMRQREGSARSQVERSFTLGGEVTAGRVIGGSGSTVCVRTERVRSLPQIEVSRRIVCLDATDGSARLSLVLPPPGIYQPRTEAAIAAGRLSFIVATESGLLLHNRRIDGEVAP
ncbi:MAG: hypothetical protein R3B13_34590 [Polyangiaceae bacterium]